MANWKTLREVVVPTEHGGWGFTTEPVGIGPACSARFRQR